MTEEEKTPEQKDLEAKLATNIGKMEIDVWPNLVLLKDGYWFVAERITNCSRCGSEMFLEFDLVQEMDYQFVKNRYEIGKCLNGCSRLRAGLSVNASNIMTIQQFES